MGAFAPFTDFDATKAELAKLKKDRDSDRAGNLERRMAHFMAKDPELAMAKLGFVPNIIENGFTAAGFAGEGDDRDLAYSIGLFYTHGFPELMLIGETPDVSVQQLNAILQMAGGIASQAGEKVVATDDAETLTANGKALVEGVMLAVQAAELEPVFIGQPDEAFLDRYAYGYGWYFYQHFLDDHQVPLLLVRLAPGRPAAAPVQIRVTVGGEDEVFWAEPLGDDRYRVDNFVSTACHMAPSDIVRCKASKGQLPKVVEVVERGPYCAIGLIFDEEVVGRSLEAVVEVGLGMEVALKGAAPAKPPSPAKVERTLKAFFATKIGGIVETLHELGCEPHFLTGTTMGLSVPREALDEVRERLDAAPLEWEFLCGPDAPTPFAGPFDPPEEN